MKISRRDAEVAVGPVAYNPDFTVTYLTWFYTHKFVILSARPQEVPKLFSLLLPFSPMVWLCFAVTMILLTIIKYVIMVIQNNPKQAVNHNHMQRKDAGRIIIAMSLFTVFIVDIFYFDSLLSILVSKEFEQPIDTMQDLLDSNLPMYYPGKTAIAKFLVDYPSTEMKQIMKSQAKTFPFVGKIPSYVKDRLVWRITTLIKRTLLIRDLHSRVLNQAAVFIHSAHNINPRQRYYHASKQILWQPVHSMVVPNGSPLEVRCL